jgi:O-antigen/teichoic acid export membrane protein
LNDGYRKHYGWSAIRASLTHFLLGKAFRMLWSAVIFLILVRLLPTGEYAVYISFNAVIIAIGVITAIGVQNVLYRYLPELRATGNNIVAYRLLFGGLIVRMVVVSAMFLAILPFVTEIARVFQFTDWAWLFSWYLLMGYLRLTALWLSQCLESFLWQRESQYSLAAGSSVTAISLASLALAGNLRLELVVIAELAGEATSLSLLILGWLRRWRTDAQRGAGDPGWWRANRSRVLRYGGWSYLLSQSSLLYGSAPNRLVAAHFLPGTDVAVLGAADSILNMLRKALPTRMFMSMLRPLAMARFSSTGDFQAVASLSEFAFRLNLMLLIFPVVVLAVVGPELMEWLTKGKYASAGYLLMGFIVVLIAEASRTLIELMVQALEKNPIFFWTSLIQSASILVAVPLLPILGLWSLVIANFATTIVANTIVIVRLRRQGYAYAVNRHLVTRLLFHSLLAGGAGWATWHFSESLIATIGVITGVYFLLIALRPPLVKREQVAIYALVRNRFSKSRNSAKEPDSAPKDS